jgi:hypothetical protein
MAVAINTVVGASDANSYCDEATASAYFDARLNIAAWIDASPDDRARALVMAARRLDQENWQGERVTTTQKLAWPRSGVSKVDAVEAYGLGIGYPFGWGSGVGDWYLTTEIPQPVKDAQCELALSLLAQATDGNAGERRVKNFSADGISVNYEYTAPVGSLPSEAMRLISGLIQGPRLMRG